MTKKNLYGFYTLAVCLFCVIAVTLGIGSFAYNLIGIKWPEYTINSRTVLSFSNNERFVDAFKRNDPCVYSAQIKCRILPTKEEEITARREKELAEATQEERSEHIHKIIEDMPYQILFLLLGFIHWRLFKTIKE